MLQLKLKESSTWSSQKAFFRLIGGCLSSTRQPSADRDQATLPGHKTTLWKRCISVWDWNESLSSYWPNLKVKRSKRGLRDSGVVARVLHCYARVGWVRFLLTVKFYSLLSRFLNVPWPYGCHAHTLTSGKREIILVPQSNGNHGTSELYRTKIMMIRAWWMNWTSKRRNPMRSKNPSK